MDSSRNTDIKWQNDLLMKKTLKMSNDHQDIIKIYDLYDPNDPNDF